MDIPADRVRWAPQILEEEQEDMVDSPTPPGPDPSVEAVSEASGDKSWHVLSEGASSGATGDVSQMHDLQQHVQQTGVSVALSALRSSKRIKLPWEQGPLAPLFSRSLSLQSFDIKPSTVGIADVLNPQPKVQAAFPKPLELKAPSHFAKKRIACASYNVPDDELRSRALNRFRVLVSLDLHATQIGTSMLNCLGSLDTSTDVLQVLSDALANKATGTLLKRASSLWRWASWVAENNKGTCFDQREDSLYEYMNHLRDSGAAPTSASHFIEAMRFSDQMFKLLKMDLSFILSSRVTGAAHRMFLQKRKLQQAPAFSVAAVAVFEGLCNEDPRNHVRIIAGCILFCIFACVRWFDAMRVESVNLDKYVTMSLLEAETARHKTSMTKEAKTRLLPYTSLGRFLGASDWADKFMAAREKAGLNRGTLFLPSWNEVSQTWANHPMSSGEATTWIREFLADAHVEFPQRFSSHSCKCTLLTWAGMCTVFTREERTLLGHHVEPQTKSSTTYSRDSQILLQYKVLKVINLIRAGKLKPDASRAERLSMLVQQDARSEEADLSKTLEEVFLEESDENSDDVDLEEVAEPQTGLDESLDVMRDPIPQESFDMEWYIHSFTGVVHAGRLNMSDFQTRLLCGRSLTVNMSPTNVDSSEMKTGLLCMQCSAALKREQSTEDDVEPVGENHQRA